MELLIKKPTVKAFLNQKFRVPQRTTPTNLRTGVVILENTFKNKRIIEVFTEINYRFEQRI
jgi:hypothetical protein